MDNEWLADRFEDNRAYLRAVAHRMLGSSSDADDAVQEAWIRLTRVDAKQVDNLSGWLTTVVARVCLDMLRSRTSRREEPLDDQLPDQLVDGAKGTEPEHEAVLADSVGPALLAVLDTLRPAERLAFVLHDIFDVPFQDIAPIIDRSPAAARQLASRARRRLQGANPGRQDEPTRQREIVQAFLAATRNGQFETLLSLLDPDVVLRADRIAVHMATAHPSAPPLSATTRGARAVADTFVTRARRGAQPALINGAPGAGAWSIDGQLRVVFTFACTGGRITAIDVICDPDRIHQLDVTRIND